MLSNTFPTSSATPNPRSTAELLKSVNTLETLLRKPSASQTAHVLVVEDDPNLLEGICAVLEISGYRVTTAVDGRDALERLHQLAGEMPNSTPHPSLPVGSLPDLIVSDIMMPNMDGIEFLRAVRQRPDWINIPFIFLTALSEKTDIQRGKQHGVDDYVVKPFEADDLVIAVESRLQRHRALSAAHTEEMSDLKRRILTILNHEFRTPLTFVVAYSDLLNMHTSEEPLSGGEMLNFLKGVNAGAARLRRLIENFILLVELETGDARLNYDLRRTAVSDVKATVDKAITHLRDTLGATNPITVYTDADLPSVLADPDYLRVALAQLLDNAIKFSPPDAPVQIGARRVALAADKPGVQFWVRDHGRGISPDELELIWSAFYQINRAVHEDQGAGSGLAIVRGIADLHGGTTHVESVPGEGSTFSITFPAQEEQG